MCMMFQSSPTPGSRCNIFTCFSTSGYTSIVSILTDSWESVQLSRKGTPVAETLGVSILTDSWESVQPRSVGLTTMTRGLFQSSPTPGSRCNLLLRLDDGLGVRIVSILTDSWESVQRPDQTAVAAREVVSILTDSWESVQRRFGRTPLGNHAVSILTDSWESVQQGRADRGRDRRRVSILTDSWESVQPSAVSVSIIMPCPFQSSPTPGSRCNARRWSSLSSARMCFNPHRLLGVGATRTSTGRSLPRWTFQSSPTPGSRCNESRPGSLCSTLVSILTDSWESVQPEQAIETQIGLEGFQSSPTPGSRCNPRPAGTPLSAGPRFNPHRLLGVGATSPTG